MTKEEKQLLLKDLCARLPYGVKAKFEDTVIDIIAVNSYGEVYPDCVTYTLPLDKVTPFLRPMLSMTEEELEEYERANDIDTTDSADTLKENIKARRRVRIAKWYHGVDWLNSHHFDYRGLIPMGLALEAKEGMYN